MKEKELRDLINWAKSELKIEEHPKLGKSMNPYRQEKIKFLRNVIKRLERTYEK